MNKDPQVNPREFSEAIQELRDEIRRDVRGLTSSIESRAAAKSGISPLAVVACVFGSLFVGAAGMSVYDSRVQAKADAAAPKVDVRADLAAAIAPFTQQMDAATQTLAATQESATEATNAHGLLLDDLAKTVTSLQETTEAQNTAFHERLDIFAEELAAKIGERSDGDQPTVAARQTIPDSTPPAVQPASAEEDISETDSATDAAKAATASSATDESKSAEPTQEEPEPAKQEANKPELGELIISNLSPYDLKLLINGEPIDVKARGATTIAVTVGTVKTQIASVPSLVQNWNDWKSVDGVQRLTINVESSNGYYKLR